jgi:Bacterial SH3 domain
MNSRLVLTLWLVGAVLYAGSTMFLAHAVLGGSAPADKAKVGAVATAANAQCQKDTITSADAKPVKDAANDPQKTGATQPKKPAPAPAPSAAKPAAPETATHDLAPQRQTPGAEQRSAEDHPSSDNQQDPDASSPDGAPGPDGWQQQDAMAPGAVEGPAEKDEWARVVAGTADMRSEPSMQAQLIYALPAGWQVRVISRQPGWVQVQDANSGAAGWVESSAIAPIPDKPSGPGRPGYGADQRAYDPYNRYAEDGYPYPPPPWRMPGGPFGDFLRRTLGGW